MTKTNQKTEVISGKEFQEEKLYKGKSAQIVRVKKILRITDTQLRSEYLKLLKREKNIIINFFLNGILLDGHKSHMTMSRRQKEVIKCILATVYDMTEKKGIRKVELTKEIKSKMQIIIKKILQQNNNSKKALLANKKDNWIATVTHKKSLLFKPGRAYVSALLLKLRPQFLYIITNKKRQYVDAEKYKFVALSFVHPTELGLFMGKLISNDSIQEEILHEDALNK
jgi:hypothetical protein|tara:strand:+ start:1209 stop:1886 length:678 start_codon:yes stop_codon:yes gene_type:complete